MAADETSLGELISTLVRPAREATGRRGILPDHADDYSSRRLWPLSQAADVIRAFTDAGVAVVQGEILEATERGLSHVVAPGLVEGSGYGNWGQPSIQWGCTRRDGEAWRDYALRAAETCLAPVGAMEQEVMLGRDGDFRVDLGFVTEDEPALFEHPEYLRRALWLPPNAEEAHGLTALNWGRAGDQRRVNAAGAMDGSFYGSLARRIATLPRNARYARIDGRANDLARLPELQALEHLAIWRVSAKVLELIAELRWLRVLEMHVTNAPSLAPLERLRQLEYLFCEGRRALQDVSALRSLPRLSWLSLCLPGLTDLTQIGELEGLQVLHLTGEKGNVDSLAPLAALGNLRRFHMWGIGVRDQSLRPLFGLKKLLRLDVQTSRFTIDEFAELAAALPDTAGPHRSPWVFSGLMAQITACRRCGGSGGYSTIGKPNRSFCFKCDAAKIAKHVARWEILISAARTRQSKES